jgi:hypothetical protein
MSRPVLIVAGALAVAVVAIGIFLSQLNLSQPPGSGTDSCATPPASAAPAETPADGTKSESDACSVPGDRGKPGEPPKN